MSGTDSPCSQADIPALLHIILDLVSSLVDIRNKERERAEVPHVILRTRFEIPGVF